MPGFGVEVLTQHAAQPPKVGGQRARFYFPPSLYINAGAAGVLIVDNQVTLFPSRVRRVCKSPPPDGSGVDGFLLVATATVLARWNC